MPDSGTLTATVEIRNGGPKVDRFWGVTVTNPNGGSDTLLGAFGVFPGGPPAGNSPPNASLTYGTSDLAADFIDTSTDIDGAIVSWTWDFGDGNGSSRQDPTHVYAAAGTYTVGLTVTDDDGDATLQISGTARGGVQLHVLRGQRHRRYAELRRLRQRPDLRQPLTQAPGMRRLEEWAF